MWPGPDARAGVRPGAHRGARPVRLRRGVGRRAPLRRLRADRQPRDRHRGRRAAHPAHPAGHRRRLDAVSPPVAAGRPDLPARPPHPRPADLRHRAGGVADRCLRARHRPGRPAAAARGGTRSRTRPVPRRGAGQPGVRLVHHARGPAPAAAVPVAPPRGRGGGDGLAVGAAAGRAVRGVAAVAVHVRGGGGLRRDRQRLGGGGGAGRKGGRARAGPVELAGARPDAPGPDPRAGRAGLHLRAEGLRRLLRLRRRVRPARRGRRGGPVRHRVRRAVRRERARDDRYPGRRDRLHRGAARAVRGLRHVPHARPRLGTAGGDHRVLPAVRPARDPTLQGQARGAAASHDWAVAKREEIFGPAGEAIVSSIKSHAAEGGAR